MPEPEPLFARRVVAVPNALDEAVWPAGVTVLRTAADEVLAIGEAVDGPRLADPHAITVLDSGWVGFRISPGEAAWLMECQADWSLPARGFAQGMVAGLAAKVLVDGDCVLFVVAAVVAAEFEARLDQAGEAER